MPLVEFETVATLPEAQQAGRHCVAKGGQNVQIKALPNGKFVVLHEVAQAPPGAVQANSLKPIQVDEFNAFKAGEAEWEERRRLRYQAGIRDSRAATRLAADEAA